MNEYIQKFETWLKADSMADNTVLAYVNDVKKFTADTGITDPKLITREVLNEYFATLKTKYKQNYVNRINKALRKYLTYYGIELIFPKQKAPMLTIPQVITEEELEEKIDPMIDMLFDNPIKVKCIVFFLFYSALRAEEIASLTRKDFDLDKYQLTVKIPKQNKERIVVITKRMKEILHSYFLSEGEVKSAFNISYDGIYRITKKLKQIFKDRNIYPHLFRHSSCTHMLTKGMGLKEVKEFVGHKDIKTTEKYLHINVEHIKKVVHEKIK